MREHKKQETTTEHPTPQQWAITLKEYEIAFSDRHFCLTCSQWVEDEGHECAERQAA
jgi:hypothetical protein